MLGIDFVQIGIGIAIGVVFHNWILKTIDDVGTWLKDKF